MNDNAPDDSFKSYARRFAPVAALLFALVFAVYWPALGGGFVWDDLFTVAKNPLVTGEFNLRTIWLQADFPLTTIALWLQWSLFGKNPAGYHVVNVLLHAANVFLLWRLLTRLKIPGAGLAALLFAVHPVCVASVAWISELKNTLSLFFFLASFLFYLRSTEAGRRLYWLSILCFLLALLSKTSVVVLPAVLLGCEWWRSRSALNLNPNLNPTESPEEIKLTIKNLLLRLAPFFALAIAFGLMTVWFQTHQVIRGDTVQTENFPGRLAGAGWAIWFYLGKALLPVNLCMIYPRWEINGANLLAFAPLILFAGILGACWWFRRRWPRHIFFGLTVFAVTLFPVLGFFDMYFFAIARVADHFQYVSLIVVLALVAAGLCEWCPPKILKIVSPLLVLVLAVLTFQRAKVFSSDEALWRDTLAKNPASWNAHNNLACDLAERGEIGEAMREFEASLKLNPRNTKALCNLGRGLMMSGQTTEAEARFLAALKIKPDDADAHNFYAQLLAGAGKIPQAIEHFRETVLLRPDAETRLQLAQLLVATGNKAGAVAEYRLALAAKPDALDALNNLAFILATCSDEKIRNGTEAVQIAERAVRLTENKQPNALGTLAAAYAEAGRFPDAIITAGKAIQLANATGNTQFAGAMQQLLGLYRAGRPYHEPPPSAPR